MLCLFSGCLLSRLCDCLTENLQFNLLAVVQNWFALHINLHFFHEIAFGWPVRSIGKLIQNLSPVLKCSGCSAAKFLPFLLAGIKSLAAPAVSPVAAFQTAAFWFPGGAAYPPGSAEQPEPWVALSLNQPCSPPNGWVSQRARIFFKTIAEVDLACRDCAEWVWPCTPCTETETDL